MKYIKRFKYGVTRWINVQPKFGKWQSALFVCHFILSLFASFPLSLSLLISPLSNWEKSRDSRTKCAISRLSKASWRNDPPQLWLAIRARDIFTTFISFIRIGPAIHARGNSRVSIIETTKAHQPFVQSNAIFLTNSSIAVSLIAAAVKTREAANKFVSHHRDPRDLFQRQSRALVPGAALIRF